MAEKISKFKTTQLMINGAFEIYHYREPYFKSLDFHTHDFYEAYLFLDGGVTYYIEDKAYDLTPGDLLLIPPGRMHRPVILDSAAVYERIVLWIHTDYLHLLDDAGGTLEAMLSCFGEKLGYWIRLREEPLRFAMGLMNRLVEIAAETSPQAHFQQQALIATFLVRICTVKSAFADETPPAKSVSWCRR